MTRGSRNGLAFAAACGAAAGVVLAYAPAPARPADDRNAVDVPAALERSQSHGWPHAPSVTEARPGGAVRGPDGDPGWRGGARVLPGAFRPVRWRMVLPGAYRVHAGRTDG